MQSIGAQAEAIAKHYLAQQGLRWVASNVRYKCGELDLIMRDQQMLVFVEVKYRKNQNYGGAISAISTHKIQKLTRAAQLYLQKNQIDCPCRFDLVAIDGQDIQWLKNIISS